MPTVFVTGAGGLIGRALSRNLIARGWIVRGFGLGEQFYREPEVFRPLLETGRFSFEMGSILDRFAVQTAMAGCDSVVHLAAMSGLRKTEAQPLHCFDINVNGTRNVLESCVAAGIGHVVVASSSAVYGEPGCDPVPETAEVKPRNIYGLTKLMGEELVRGYSQSFPALAHTIVRPFNSYGEGGNAAFIVNAFVARVLAGRNPVAHGDGSQTRCYTHADDVAIALGEILARPVARNKTYNLGNPAETLSVAELGRRVIAVLAPDAGLDLDFEPVSGDLVRSQIHSSRADIARARADLGFSPAISLDEGILRVARWMQGGTA